MSGAPRTTGGMSRRAFIATGTAAVGGLVIGFNVPSLRRVLLDADAPPLHPNAWLFVGADDRVRIVVDEMEMGQGVMTSMPMLVAEELAVPWKQVKVEYGMPDPGAWPRRVATGGSTSTRMGWRTMRMAGATAREMLKTAAGRKWGVDPASLTARDGRIVDDAGGRHIRYGRLVEAAAKLQPPPEDSITLKPPSRFQLLGSPVHRVDTPPKTDGSQIYSLDVRVPDMLYAVIARPPVFGGKLRSYKDEAARRVPGVRTVVRVAAGVVVVADDTWAAIQGRKALVPDWDDGPLAQLDEAAFWSTMQRLADGPGLVARDDGDAPSTLREAASSTLRAVYRVPYLAHATMEPMNCTAHVHDGGVEVWAPTQNATGSQQAAAEVAGVDVHSVTMHEIPMGGGFGRRSQTDFVREAVAVSKEIGRPVKVVWTREDDTRGGYYRPAAYHRIEAALGRDGLPTAWRHRVVAPGILAQRPGWPADRVDRDAVAGAADLPYAIPNVRVEWTGLDRPEIPVWFWRSVGHSHNAFVTECFVDELAVKAGLDPVEYRRRLLRKHPRHLGVLELAAEKAGWGGALPEGHHHGVAVHHAFDSYVAWVAEVSIDDDAIHVHRVTGAVDHGWTVNPDTVRAQMQGGMAYGLTAALHGRLTLKGGRVVQGNFDTYEMLRMDAMPEVAVHVVDSTEDPGGMGEPPTPPIAPAVANAVFAATGRRLRRLPLEAGTG